MSEFNWGKPVLSFYCENNEKHEREPFAVVKAKKLIVTKADQGELSGKIEDFFCLMGDVDQVQPDKHYVICWFDDSVDNFYEAFRRMSGVTFPTSIGSTVDKGNKRTYNTTFQARHAKLI